MDFGGTVELNQVFDEEWMKNIILLFYYNFYTKSDS